MLIRRGFGRVGRPGLLGLAARTAVVAGTATAVAGGVSRHQQRRAQEESDAAAYQEQQAAAPYNPPPQYQEPAYQQPAQVYQQPPPPPASGTDNLIVQLQQLGQLRDSGVLTDAEFATQKAKLLNA